MNSEIAAKVDAMQIDYTSVTGRAFEHFYCPILFSDEPVALCQAHVVNKAFPNSDRRWTVQRKDVDSFFGSRFESDFVVLAAKGQHDPFDVLTDRHLSRRIRPTLTIDGQSVDHYFPRTQVPPFHSALFVEREGRAPVKLALKLDPSATLSVVDRRWEITIDKDVRLPSLVSLLKAAHLTLFELVGYRYALSAAGRFVGWDVLGTFVNRCMHLARSAAIAQAREHFPQFVNMVRPMLVPPNGLLGTITDGYLYLCAAQPKAWAFMLLIRTGAQTHAAIVPVLEDPEAAARFVRFLQSPTVKLEVRLARYSGERWEVAKDSRYIDWPEAKFG